MTQINERQAKFEQLFNAPELGIENLLHDLTWDEFEDFVGYVFQQAGYVVEDTATQFGQALDLKLYSGHISPQTLQVGVSIKQYDPIAHNRVTGPEVTNLRGGLSAAGIGSGFFVTTSTFNGPALTATTQGPPRIWPVDGEHLLRYITYIRGSRPNIDANISGAISLPNFSLAPISPEALISADAISRRSVGTTKILTVANHKGGVGKTTQS